MALIGSTAPDDDGYVTHFLDEPHYGWVYNDAARIRLDGQTTFQLQGDNNLTFDTPADLVTE